MYTSEIKVNVGRQLSPNRVQHLPSFGSQTVKPAVFFTPDLEQVFRAHPIQDPVTADIKIDAAGQINPSCRSFLIQESHEFDLK